MTHPWLLVARKNIQRSTLPELVFFYTALLFRNSHMLKNICLSYKNKLFLLIFTLFFISIPTITLAKTVIHTEEKPTSAELHIDNSDPVFIEIDTEKLKKQIDGKVPIQFISNDNRAVFDSAEGDKSKIYWHTQNNIGNTDDQESKLVNDRYIRLRLNNTEDMVGKKLKVILEREVNLSKIAAIGAFIPQVIPVAVQDNVTWQPYSFWTTLLRWNYLLLDIDIIHSIRQFVQSQVFTDNSDLISQCSADFVEGFTTFALLANHGQNNTGDIDKPTANQIYEHDHQFMLNPVSRSKTDTFRLFLRTNSTNRMLDCVSSAVSYSLKSLRDKGELKDLFGDRPSLDLANDQTIDGVAMLMVGYGFNYFSDIPGNVLSPLRDKLGLSHLDDLSADINGSLKTSIQYTIHNGYTKFFKGNGFSNMTSYLLSSGIGIFEIIYRLQIISRSIGAEQNEASFILENEGLYHNLQHQLTSVGDRAEAIASSVYQFSTDSVTSMVSAIAWPLITYASMNQFINHYYTGGQLIGTQKIATSLANGLTLGALMYVISPKLKKIGANATQKVADQFVRWTDSEKESWIGHFAAKDIQYQIRLVVED